MYSHTLHISPHIHHTPHTYSYPYYIYIYYSTYTHIIYTILYILCPLPPTLLHTTPIYIPATPVHYTPNHYNHIIHTTYHYHHSHIDPTITHCTTLHTIYTPPHTHIPIYTLSTLPPPHIPYCIYTQHILYTDYIYNT